MRTISLFCVPAWQFWNEKKGFYLRASNGDDKFHLCGNQTLQDSTEQIALPKANTSIPKWTRPQSRKYTPRSCKMSLAKQNRPPKRKYALTEVNTPTVKEIHSQKLQNVPGKAKSPSQKQTRPYKSKHTHSRFIRPPTFTILSVQNKSQYILKRPTNQRLPPKQGAHRMVKTK